MKESNLIICNPGQNCSTSVQISWHAPLSCLNSYCIYTTVDDLFYTNGIKVTGVYNLCNAFDSVISLNQDKAEYYQNISFLHYKVILNNLKPNTKYKYKVGENNLSCDYYFKTSSDDFTFLWISDFHTYNFIPQRLESCLSLSNKIKSIEPIDFIVCGGDSISWGGSYAFWEKLYESNLVKSHMFVNMLGNHDFMSRRNLKNTKDYFNACNYNPQNSFFEELNTTYHFVYGNTLFIILNSETMGFKESGDIIYKTRQYLRKVLSKNTSSYIFIFQHYEWFQGINGASRIWGYLRFKDIFDEFNVEFACGNNNHIYLRTKPVYKDIPSNNGTIYIQSPSLDNERGQVLKPLLYNKDIIEKRFSEGSKTVGSIVISVNNDFVTIKLYNRDLLVIDYLKVNCRKNTTF